MLDFLPNLLNTFNRQASTCYCVGDIPLYLKDRENAFLSDPDSAEAFAIELRYILNNYEFALEVGGNGKD